MVSKSSAPEIAQTASIDAIDRALIVATQAGLPLVERPYAQIAASLQLTEPEVLQRMQDLQTRGIVRRIGVIPNHYKLGYRANGMSVWNVPDEVVDEIGKHVGALTFVTHCYCRPRHLPDWPYNLFAMVHGKTREEVEEKVQEIASLLGAYADGHRVLFSTRILKKTGLRLNKIL
jgi:DNA-binding Lrp family transcriptional regulator